MSNLLRRTHRWISLVFTVTVVANIVVIALGQEDPNWVTYAPLPPLALLLITGLYLFALPYVHRMWRR